MKVNNNDIYKHNYSFCLNKKTYCYIEEWVDNEYIDIILNNYYDKSIFDIFHIKYSNGYNYIMYIDSNNIITEKNAKQILQFLFDTKNIIITAITFNYDKIMISSIKFIIYSDENLTDINASKLRVLCHQTNYDNNYGINETIYLFRKNKYNNYVYKLTITDWSNGCKAFTFDTGLDEVTTKLILYKILNKYNFEINIRIANIHPERVYGTIREANNINKYEQSFDITLQNGIKYECMEAYTLETNCIDIVLTDKEQDTLKMYFKIYKISGNTYKYDIFINRLDSLNIQQILSRLFNTSNIHIYNVSPNNANPWSINYFIKTTFTIG